MPYGTASNRLRKLLLFSLAQKLELDICYRCSLKIYTVESFSIEHKNGWELAKNPIEAFFNLEDIAFSHLICNIKASSNRGIFNKGKTHCPQGHEYTKENTYSYRNQRDCRQCTKKRITEYRNK